MRQKTWIPGAARSPVLAALTLPGVERSVGHARAFVTDTLVPDILAADGELIDDVVLVVDELVGNSIRHTRTGDGGKVTVVLVACDGVLRPEVTDDGADTRPHVLEEFGGESGRGLRIVEALSDKWGYRDSGRRRTVWAEFKVGGNCEGGTDTRRP
ncbi:ATP-binding protein [Actinomadura barringtoniae]|uniref:ATP-binding protein n=1 Tax=Actinomadura barringtoniae TaxID=1427535 RepID=A0A939T9Z1_9ACTN|nr:ATP-binding protein [Actinomadura barringtoniae]MBO2455603.1 ATP-binding protein [Actinomadura barringtoniae]